MKLLHWVLGLLVLLTASPAAAQSIEVPYRGLDYSMVSKEGVTVMIAPLDLILLDYSAAHVWITNGSQETLEVEPRLFRAKARTMRHPQPAEVGGLSERLVVEQVLRRARHADIMGLVRAYERNLYGFDNNDAINYYQVRKQMAAAEGGGRKMRAAATVSALVLPKTVIPPGEFREGTVFFPATDRNVQFVEFSLELGELSFRIQPNAPRQLIVR
jgi:hypothetical protein